MVLSEEMWSCLRVKPEEKNGNVKTSDSASAALQNPSIYILVANLKFSTDDFSDSSFSLHILHFLKIIFSKLVYNTVQNICMSVFH